MNGYSVGNIVWWETKVQTKETVVFPFEVESGEVVALQSLIIKRLSHDRFKLCIDNCSQHFKKPSKEIEPTYSGLTEDHDIVRQMDIEAVRRRHGRELGPN